VSAVKLTVEMLRKAKEKLLEAPVPTTCPICKGPVSNDGTDILHVSPRGKLSCGQCLIESFYKEHISK
jgi:hypothetical protein